MALLYMSLAVCVIMRCELCGTEAKFLKDTKIEKSVLKLCSGCARMGSTPTERERLGVKGYVDAQLDRRARRMTSKPVEVTWELADDYSLRVRKGREQKGWDQETLARKLAEKRTVLAKIESGSFHPDDKLVKKLERTLGIKLMVRSESEVVVGTAPTKGLTLGDLILQARQGEE